MVRNSVLFQANPWRCTFIQVNESFNFKREYRDGIKRRETRQMYVAMVMTFEL